MVFEREHDRFHQAREGATKNAERSKGEQGEAGGSSEGARGSKREAKGSSEGAREASTQLQNIMICFAVCLCQPHGQAGEATPETCLLKRAS